MPEKGSGNRRQKRSVQKNNYYLDRDEREFIDSLIKQGKEAGIKPLISRCLTFTKLTIHNWRFQANATVGISRVAFINVELVDIAVKNIPKKMAKRRKKHG